MARARLPLLAGGMAEEAGEKMDVAEEKPEEKTKQRFTVKKWCVVVGPSPPSSTRTRPR